MCSYDGDGVGTKQQNEDSGIEKELLNIFEECDESGTNCVRVSQLIDKIKFFLQGNENTQEILAVVKLKLDPNGSKTFITKEYFIQCVSEWLHSTQQQEQQPVNGDIDDDDDDDNVFLPIADINGHETAYSFDRGMKIGRNIYHSTPIIKKPTCFRKARTIDVYLSQPDSPDVSVEAHTALENEIKEMKQDMLTIMRERDQFEMTVNDLRNHVSIIEKKNSASESLLTQTVNKLKTEVEKKHELEKCNEELVKMNNDTEKEMAHVNKKFASLMKTCEDQRAQNSVLEQMLSDETDKNKKQKDELEKIVYDHNEEKEMFTDKIALLTEEIAQKNFAQLNLEKQNAELQQEINSQITITQNLRLEIQKCKSSATKAEEKYLQMKLNVDQWLKNLGDVKNNIKGSLGSPEEISLISTTVFGFSPVKYESSLMAEIGTELDNGNEYQSDEDCIIYETLSTQTEFVNTKLCEDAASQTEDNATIRNKRQRVCEKFVKDSLTFVYVSQMVPAPNVVAFPACHLNSTMTSRNASSKTTALERVDHWTQTVSNDVIDSAMQTDETSQRTCSVGCGDNSSFYTCNQYSQTLLKSCHKVDAATQTGEPSDGFEYQKIHKKPDTTRRGKKWVWFGVTSVTFIMIFCLLFHTMIKWTCNSPCCMKSGQYLWSLNKLFLSRNRNTVPV